jgi:hypothetical protein
MIEVIYGNEPFESGGPSTVAVQYDRTGGDIGLGVTMNRKWLETYLRDNPGPDGMSQETPDNGVTFFVRMERGSANRLVRLLRKARDITFGKDE